MSTEYITLAKNIIEKHVSNDPTSSWGSCSECRQHHWGQSEAQPKWPCDARHLADIVLEHSKWCWLG